MSGYPDGVTQSSHDREFNRDDEPKEPTIDCPECRGNGFRSNYRVCTRCDGWGKVEDRQ